MGTHPCGHVIACAWLHECGMVGDSIRRALAFNAFDGKKIEVDCLSDLRIYRKMPYIEPILAGGQPYQ